MVLWNLLAAFSKGPMPKHYKDAVEQGFGRRPVFVREGGSIGAVATLTTSLESPYFIYGIESARTWLPCAQRIF